MSNIVDIRYIEFTDNEIHNVIHELDNWLVSNTIQTNTTNYPRINSFYFLDMVTYCDVEKGWVIGVYHGVDK